MGTTVAGPRAAAKSRSGFVAARQDDPALFRAGGNELTAHPSGDSPFGQQPNRGVRCLGRDQPDHADAHVQRGFQVGLRDLSEALHQVEDRRRTPAASLKAGSHGLGQHAGKVVGQPAAGDVAHRVHLDAPDQGQRIAGVDPRRFQQFLAEGASQFVDVRVEAQAGVGEQDTPHQRIAVAVQA
mgnify:CR=1 FL=1